MNLDEGDWFYEEKEKSNIHDDLLRFIKDTKVKLNIVFPEYVNHFLISEEIATTISSKKLEDNINIKLLYYYNENTKPIIKRISPFVFLKRLEFSVNDSYIFLRDDHDFFVIDSSKLSLLPLTNVIKESKCFNDVDNQSTQKSTENTDSLYTLYSKNNSLVSWISSFFNSLWFQKEAYDNMMEEKSHSDLLVDLITHDVGNHHSIIQAGLEMINYDIESKVPNHNEPNIQDKDSNNNRIAKTNGHDSNILSTKDKSQYDQHVLFSQNKENQINISKEFLQDLLSRTQTIQNALDRSQDLVKNILKLEKMYRQKEVNLVPINLIEDLEKAKQSFRNNKNINKNNTHDITKKLELNIAFPSHYKKEDICIQADDLLKEAFINLFSNAMKYSNKSDSVVKVDVLIAEYMLSNVSYWMITIADYGRGIPDSVKENLFERFYSKASGTGLGLSIVRALVERYNGRVWVSDRVATSFTNGASIGMMFPKP